MEATCKDGDPERTTTTRDPAIVAHYTFDEDPGGKVRDDSGHQNDGVNHGAEYVRGPAGTGNGLRCENPQAVVGGVTPRAGSLLGGTFVAVEGSAFAGAGPVGVAFGNSPALQVNVLSDTRLTCVTPPGFAVATVDVQVINGNGTGLLTNGFDFVSAPPPGTARSVAPNPRLCGQPHR